jgi:hypothetical protein
MTTPTKETAEQETARLQAEQDARSAHLRRRDPDVGLVAMKKAGEEDLKVHPTCVKDHERVGWKVAQ